MEVGVPGNLKDVVFETSKVSLQVWRRSRRALGKTRKHQVPSSLQVSVASESHIFIYTQSGHETVSQAVI